MTSTAAQIETAARRWRNTPCLNPRGVSPPLRTPVSFVSDIVISCAVTLLRRVGNPRQVPRTHSGTDRGVLQDRGRRGHQRRRRPWPGGDTRERREEGSLPQRSGYDASLLWFTVFWRGYHIWWDNIPDSLNEYNRQALYGVFQCETADSGIIIVDAGSSQIVKVEIFILIQHCVKFNTICWTVCRNSGH